MNCANHPDTPVVAYCQFCGKPLCVQCAHKINNIVGCESCFAARIGATTGAGPIPPGTQPPQSGCCMQPWLAFCLGWIPGVGAMYNGQFAKALIHVLVFAFLVSLSDQHGFLGILVASWVFYQVFDAYQTAIARRDGLPLPNPLGLNDAAQWFGIKSSAPYSAAGPYPANPVPPAPGTVAPDPTANPMGSSSGFASSAPGATPFTQPYGQPFSPPNAAPFTGYTPPVPPDQADIPDLRRGIPTGAIVLVVIGVAFLLGNMGIFSAFWLDKSWPLLLIGFGIWLLIQRSQNPPPGGVR